MYVKTFRARNLQQALLQVRQELGPDAAVLQTRNVQHGLFGFFGSHLIEVTASNTVRVPSRLGFLESPDWNAANSLSEELLLNRKATGDSQNPADPSLVNSPRSEDSPVFAMRSENPRPVRSSRGADEASRTLANIQTPAEITPSDFASPCTSSEAMPNTLLQAFTGLLEQDFDPTTARQMIAALQSTSRPEELNDPCFIKGRLMQSIRNQIQIGQPIQTDPQRSQIISLVGPTGVGKTTTLAKLAAEFTLEDRASVGFLTIDTYRIGAIEQLRKYAEIMDIPIEVVESANQMRPALSRLGNCSLVFIDTAGRTPRDTEQLAKLKEMLDIAQPDQTHLVLSTTTSPSNFQVALERFSSVHPSHLLLTKLDEAHGLAGLLPAIEKSSLPISYVTTGQNVPNDIQHANSTRLASLMLGTIDSSVL